MYFDILFLLGLAYCFSLIAKKLTCNYEEILNKLADYVHQVERVSHLQESGHSCQGQCHYILNFVKI